MPLTMSSSFSKFKMLVPIPSAARHHRHQQSIYSVPQSQCACQTQLHRRCLSPVQAGSQRTALGPLPASQPPKGPADLDREFVLSPAEPDLLIPLTKARKRARQHASTNSHDTLARAQYAAGFAATAVRAGAAITSVAVAASLLSVAAVALEAGAAVLPAVGSDTNKKALRPDKGAAASLSEAISLNLLAAQTLSQVLYDTTPSTPQALSQRSAVAESWQATAETAPASAAAVKSDAPAESASDTDSESASATESASANEFALAVDVDMDVDESFEFEVSIDTSDFDQSEESEMTLKLELHADEEWKNVAKIIERQTCQVAMDDVMLFADQFDPAHQLVGEVVDPAPEGGRLQPYSEVQSADQYKLNQKLRNIEDGLFKGIQHYCFKMHFSRY